MRDRSRLLLPQTPMWRPRRGRRWTGRLRRSTAVEVAQRAAVDALVELWPTSAWRAAGAVSAKAWLTAYTAVSGGDADRLVRVAELCARDRRLAEAVADGTLPLAWAASVRPAGDAGAGPVPRTARRTVAGSGRGRRRIVDVFRAAVQHWVDRVDETLAPRRVQRQSLVFSERLFGGGEIHASLAPVAFNNVVAAVDAFTQDPDPKDAPYVRTLSERRADGLDDLSIFGLTHLPGDNDPATTVLIRTMRPRTKRSGPRTPTTAPTPATPWTKRLLPENEGLDDLELIRSRIRKAEAHQRRRRRRQTRARSGTRVNVHIDLRTLAGTRDMTDLEDLVLHGDGWQLTQIRGRADAVRLLARRRAVRRQDQDPRRQHRRRTLLETTTPRHRSP